MEKQDNTLAQMIQSQVMPLSAMVPNKGQIPGVPKNPRAISKRKLELLKRSIEDDPEMLGLREILLYPYNGKHVIIGGNMRYRALKKLGRTEAIVKVLPETFTPEKLRAIAIKDNSGFGEWDWDMLANEWDAADLGNWGIDIPDDWKITPTGTSEMGEEDGFSDEDAERAEPRTKPGDIWQLGEHRLMCGDSTDAGAMASLMNGEKADMVFTDPPYGVAIGDKNKALNSVLPSGRCTENIANDNIPAKDLYPILVKAMTNCRENCKDSASYYVTSPQGGELGLMMMMRDAGLPVRHMLIWEKNCPTFSLGRLDYDYQHEPIFYTWTKSHKNYRAGEFRTTIWKYDKPSKCDLHPTMKPVALVVNCMKEASVTGDIILDVFGGSGTTIIAAEQIGRKARLMELSPHYCDVIIARWEKLTGEKAKLTRE